MIATSPLALQAHQLRLLTTASRSVVLQGGYGSGKTFGGAAFLLCQGWRNPGHPVIGVEPVYRQVEDVMVRRLDAICRGAQIGCRWLPSKKLFRVVGKAPVDVLLRSAEVPENLEGIEGSSAWVDEWEHCSVESLQRLVGRVRVGPHQRIAYTGTPEGYGEAYDWLLAKPIDVELVLARTADNGFLSSSYVDAMRSSLGDSAFASEKIDGVRSARSDRRVYQRFSRDLHCRRDAPFGRGELQIAVDFNVGYMHWLLCEVQTSTKKVHVVKEIIVKDTTTDAVARLALDECQHHLNRRGEQLSRREVYDLRIKAYCDASGNARTTQTPETDTALLRHAGFTAIHGTRNPLVADRVNTVNCALRDGLLTISLDGAPQLVRNLETQQYVNGAPDKSNNIDHAIDALGYLLHTQFPVAAYKANAPSHTTTVRRDAYGAIS